MRTLASRRDIDGLRRRIESLRPDQRALWGRMSAHQMVCHLGDALLMALGRKPVRPTTSLFKRTVLKAIVLYAPLRWPRGIETSPEIDQRLGGTEPADFAADLARLEKLIEDATAPQRTLDGSVHPLFGRMSDAEWLRWGYLHLDHHLRQFGA